MQPKSRTCSGWEWEGISRRCAETEQLQQRAQTSARTQTQEEEMQRRDIGVDMGHKPEQRKITRSNLSNPVHNMEQSPLEVLA